MSWRRFGVLLGGLPSHTRLIEELSKRSEIEKDPKEAEKKVLQVWG